MDKLQADDIVALVTIVGCFILMAFGRDGVVTSVLLTTTGYLFGRKSGVKPRKVR